VPRRKKYFDLSLKVSLPMTISSGYHTRTLTPYAELRHINALIWENDRSETGYQRLVAGLLFSDNVRMATRDFCPAVGRTCRRRRPSSVTVRSGPVPVSRVPGFPGFRVRSVPSFRPSFRYRSGYPVSVPGTVPYRTVPYRPSYLRTRSSVGRRRFGNRLTG